jgi:hypothetical protein
MFWLILRLFNDPMRQKYLLILNETGKLVMSHEQMKIWDGLLVVCMILSKHLLGDKTGKTKALQFSIVNRAEV